MKNKQDDEKLILSRLEELLEDVYDDHTEEFLEYIKHPSATVRRIAVRGLWNSNLNEIQETLVSVSEKDPDIEVQAGAISVMGRFIYEGEFVKEDSYSFEDETIDPKTIAKIRTYLEKIVYDEGQSEIKRRRAMESLSFDPSERDEKMIEHWAKSKSAGLRTSAVFSMGRAGLIKWEETIIRALDDKEKEVRREAVKALGEGCAEDGIKHLKKIIIGGDRDLVLEAILSIGKIGGDDAVDILYTLADSEDEEVAAAAEAAIAETDAFSGDDEFEDDDFPDDPDDGGKRLN
jgi:hypothetical protein